MIVIHAWWGLNDWVKDQAQKLGEAGFVALAVDLYGGHVATDSSSALDLRMALKDDVALRDMQAAFDYLMTRNDVDRDHIGVIGWDMGGAYALKLAMTQPRLGACVVNYGALPTDPNDIQLIFAPVLGNFAALDRGVLPTDVQSFEKTMKNLSRRVDIKIYDGAKHGFENPDDTEQLSTGSGSRCLGSQRRLPEKIPEVNLSLSPFNGCTQGLAAFPPRYR